MNSSIWALWGILTGSWITLIAIGLWNHFENGHPKYILPILFGLFLLVPLLDIIFSIS